MGLLSEDEVSSTLPTASMSCDARICSLLLSTRRATPPVESWIRSSGRFLTTMRSTGSNRISQPVVLT